MGKRILVVSQYFYPEQFRINDICCELAKLGHEVTVLTGIPNYPEGRFFKGYGLNKKRCEMWNGVEIIRIPLISRGKSSIRLVLNYYSFVVSGWFWSHFVKRKFDVVFTFEVSPLTQALIGMWYSKRMGIKHILYVQDLWPENLEVVGEIHNKVVLDHYAKMASKIYDSCSTVLATSPSFVEDIQKRTKNKSKVKYWPQYAEDVYKPSKTKDYELVPDDGRFKIVFTGNIGYAQGLEILPKVARLVNDDVCFVIVGDGRYKKQLIEEVRGVEDKFLFIDRQPPEKIPPILAACDVAFISFMDNPLFKKTIPAKLQSCMACGMPILAVAEGETKRIVEEAQCGVCCDIGSVEGLLLGIKQTMNTCLFSFEKNSKRYYSAWFEKTMLMNELNDVVSE